MGNSRSTDITDSLADLFASLYYSKIYGVYNMLTSDIGILSGDLHEQVDFNGKVDRDTVELVMVKLRKKKIYHEINEIKITNNHHVVFRFKLETFHQSKIKSHLPRRCLHNLRQRVIRILFTAGMHLKEDNDPVIICSKTFIVIDDEASVETLNLVVPDERIVLSRWIRQELAYRLSRKNVRHIPCKIELLNRGSKFIVIFHHKVGFTKNILVHPM